MQLIEGFPARVFVLLFLSLLVAPIVLATIALPDPQSAAGILARNMLDYPGTFATLEASFGEWIPLDAAAIGRAPGIQGEANACVSLGDFKGDPDFVEDPPGQTIRYVGTGFRDEKLSVVCGPGVELDKVAGPWAANCGCASQPALCCLVVLTEQDFGIPPPAKRTTWYPPVDRSDTPAGSSNAPAPSAAPPAQPPLPSAPATALDFWLNLLLYYSAGVALASAAFFGSFKFGFLKAEQAVTIKNKVVLFLVALPFLPWTVFLFLRVEPLVALLAPFVVIGPVLFPLLNILASGWIVASQLRVKDKGKLLGGALCVLLLAMATVLWLIMFAFWALPRAA